MTYTPRDHTFVICAYMENPCLEECIQSIKGQTIQSNILIGTSTPNMFIEHLAQKYEIPVYINEGERGMVQDWNFAYSQAKTELVTIAHQDDVYLPEYLKNVLEGLNCAELPLIFFSNYMELREGKVVANNELLRIKRLMLSPLNFRPFWYSRFIRRRILSFGCPICCPSVTFVRSNLDTPVFELGYRGAQDWQAWERISRFKGSFVYTKKCLVYHRIHEESTTTEIIAENIRANEDFDMFCKFWPRKIAKLLVRFYIKSQESNIVK